MVQLPCWLITATVINLHIYTSLRTENNIYHATQCHTGLVACIPKLYSVSQKNHPLPSATCGFLTFFHKRLRILNQFFTHLLYVPIYARLQIFIQLYHILTKLYSIKRDYLVYIICTKCPPSAKTHAFRCLRKLWLALLIVVCGKSL